jgi:predicted transcriptional regulator of viral defense system
MVRDRTTERIAPRALSDYLLAHGRPVITLAEAADLMGMSPKAAADAIVRLRRAAQIFSPAPGLYVAVPPEYRSWGAVPALDFIDPMMKALDRRYYVALLSAAELHGAAHQRPQVLQVMVDDLVGDRDFGRVKVRFFSSRRVGSVPTESRNARTGSFLVSSPEVTALDLATRPHEAGGLSNVATVLHELAEENRLDARTLVDAARSYPNSTLRRLGWLLEHVQAATETDALASALSSPNARPETLLDPGGPRRGRGDRRWGVVENSVVEPDL